MFLEWHAPHKLNAPSPSLGAHALLVVRNGARTITGRWKQVLQIWQGLGWLISYAATMLTAFQQSVGTVIVLQVAIVVPLGRISLCTARECFLNSASMQTWQKQHQWKHYNVSQANF